MTLNVHLVRPPTDEALSQLTEGLDNAVQLSFGADLPEDVPIHILVTGRPSHQQLTTSPDLRALIVPWAGLPTSTRELMQAFPHIAIHNLHHNAVPVAELALTLLLAAAKRIVPMDQVLRQHDWTPRYQRPSPSLLLAGKTALILGYGAIGRQAAQRCQALGMTVMATRRHLDAPITADGVSLHPASALPSLLPQAHALLICLPLTPQTEGLIDAEALALLPENAILVNIGRGPIVDEAALYDALRNGRLHGAGLDVWYNYPENEAARRQTPPANFPFHELDSVVMSPHRGGGTDETERLRMEHLARLLNAAACGQTMPNRVNLQAGY